MTTTIPRMPSAERRESILDAATAVFGARSYAGTTTDEVARAAGVSQPYVVRLFGSKQKLFLEVVQRAVRLTVEAFRAELDGGSEDLFGRLGRAYLGLLSRRGMLQSLSNAFLLGGDPEIGPECRRLFLDVWRFLRDEAGMSAVDAQLFLADGMLINTLIGLRLGDEYDDDAGVRELFQACLGEDAKDAIALAPRADEPW